MDFVVNFFTNNFENCVWLAILIIAIIPTLESKIAIPFAMNSFIWGSSALSPIWALLLSFVGSILPSALIILLARKIKKQTTGFVTSKFFNRYINKSLIIESKQSNFKKYLALTSFVAIPLPLTGVWAGSLIAGFSNLEIKYSLLSIALGSFISCCTITLICTIFTNTLTMILIISLLIIILFLFIDLFMSMLSKKKEAI